MSIDPSEYGYLLRMMGELVRDYQKEAVSAKITTLRKSLSREYTLSDKTNKVFDELEVTCASLERDSAGNVLRLMRQLVLILTYRRQIAVLKQRMAIMDRDEQRSAELATRLANCDSIFAEILEADSLFPDFGLLEDARH